MGWTQDRKAAKRETNAVAELCKVNLLSCLAHNELFCFLLNIGGRTPLAERLFRQMIKYSISGFSGPWSSFLLYCTGHTEVTLSSLPTLHRALSWNLSRHCSCLGRFCICKILPCRRRLCTGSRGPCRLLRCRGTEMSDKHFLLWTYRSAFMLSAVASLSPQIRAVKDGGNIEIFIPRRDFGDTRHTCSGGLSTLKSRSKRPSDFWAFCQYLSFHLACA